MLGFALPSHSYVLSLFPTNTISLSISTSKILLAAAQPKGHPPLRARRTLSLCNSYEVGGGFPEEDFAVNTGIGFRDDEQEEGKWDSARYEALLKGGEQVTSVLQEMVKLLEDMNMDDESEKVAVELAAQGVIGKRVDQMESGFMMALDYMIQLAENDHDDQQQRATHIGLINYHTVSGLQDSDSLQSASSVLLTILFVPGVQRKSLLEVIKQTVLSHLTKKCPPHVQVIGLLCQTAHKESRHELLRRVAAGGGVFQGEKGTKVQLPGANLDDIANQADDLLETMEARRTIPDRKLLARLVLIREEARNMMGGGILDERNDRGLTTLPEAEVNFLTKLVALRPGKAVQEMIADVMQGKNEGADTVADELETVDSSQQTSRGISGRASVTGRKPLPVRPGMFLETVSKVLGGIYAGNRSGITAQHLEWVHQKTLQILEEMAF